jgi:predicted outer membrane repeat protein
MKKRLTIFIAIALVLGIFLQNALAIGYTKYVTVLGAGSKNGVDWANAYDGTQLQTAINEASVSKVFVAKGTYKPTTGTERTISFQMKDNVTIYGGFAGSETTVDQRVTYGAGEVNETILSGDIGTVGDNTDNSYHVIYNWRLNSSAILDGFTITKGNANLVSGDNYHGGGMYNYQGSPTINNCRFISNYGVNGGGVYGTYSSSTINNCIFSSNSAGSQGGGVYFEYSSATFNNCTFSSNSVSTYGGAIALYAGTPTTVNNCIFWGNTTGTYGNQIALRSNSTITLNYSCYSNGTGDIYFEGGCTFTATSTNITDNPLFVNAAGGDYRVLGTSPCVDAGNDTYNTQTYDIRGLGYTRKLDKTSGATGTIDMGAFEYKVSDDPMPVELTSFTANTNGKSIELKWSTATEKNNYGFEIERKAIDNWSKIGFVEGNGTTNAPEEYSFTEKNISTGKYSYRLKQIDRDGKFTYSNSVEATVAEVKQFALEQNYPNPFNPVTMIDYQLPTNSLVTLKVFDAVGREVTTLVNEMKEAGTYSVQFNGSSFSSGVYFYTLRAGSFSAVKKLILMK